MAKPLLVVVGVLLVATGLVWTLQGFDVLKGSSMSGTTTWSIVGPITMLVGVGLAVLGFRGRRT